MGRTVTATEARVHFGELLRVVNEEGEHVTIERDGKPAGVILSASEYGRITGRASGEQIIELARRSRAELAAVLGNRDLPGADELIDGGRGDVD